MCSNTAAEAIPALCHARLSIRRSWRSVISLEADNNNYVDDSLMQL